MTIVGADTLTLEKSGPATMQIGIPGTFVIEVQNTGTSTTLVLKERKLDSSIASELKGEFLLLCKPLKLCALFPA